MCVCTANRLREKSEKNSFDIFFSTFPWKSPVFTGCLQHVSQANYSPSQLTPYDHLNMAITVTLMQVTVPPAVALILRYHTERGGEGKKNHGKEPEKIDIDRY